MMRIVHMSDLHFWHISLNPLRLAGKRLLGTANLILNRARKYRMETTPQLLFRVMELQPDHVLVSGDLTTTSLEEEFKLVRTALMPLESSRLNLTVIPGNHDRYTRPATRRRLFEKYFGQFAPAHSYPWLKLLGDGTALLGLDASRPNPFSARGAIEPDQIEHARILLEAFKPGFSRLIVACHYPVVLPEGEKESRSHGLRGSEVLLRFLAGLGPHLYCHGHIHNAWAFISDRLPQELCINPGAALRTNRKTGTKAGLNEILIEGDGVEVRRHVLRHNRWERSTLVDKPCFFQKRSR